MARSQDGAAVSVRLATTGGEQIKGTFDSIAASGERAFNKLKQSAEQANPALKAIDATSRELQSKAIGFAGAGGSFVRVLTSMGPAGMAAGVGLGIAVLAIRKAMQTAREAVNDFDELGDKIADIGVDSDLYQGLRFAARQTGIGPDQYDEALRTFATTTEQIAAGVGKAVKQLQIYNPELLRTLQTTAGVDDRLRATAEAFNKEADAVRRSTVAKMLFGDVRFGQLLGEDIDAIDRFVAKAREYGLVVDREILRTSGEMADKLDLAAQIIDTNLKSALVSLTPTLITISGWAATAAQGFADLAEGMKKVEDQSLTKLKRDLAAKEKLRADNPTGLGPSGTPFRYVTRDQMDAEISALQAEIAAREGAPGGGAVSGDVSGRLAQIAEGVARSLESVANKGERIAKVRQDLAGLEASIEAMRGKPGADNSQIDKLLADAREAATRQIQKLEEADTRAASASAAARAKELEGLAQRYAADTKYKALLADLEETKRRGFLTEEEYNTARAKAAIDYTEALEKERRAVLAMQNTFAAGVQLGLAQWSDGARKYAEQVADAIGSAMDKGTDAVTDFVVGAKVDFSSLAQSVIRDLVRIAIQQNITRPAANWLSSIASTLLGGASGLAGGVGGPSVGYVQAGINHEGYGPGGHERKRMVDAFAFINAERYHSGRLGLGIGPGERPAVIRDDESVLTPEQMRALGSGVANLNIRIINQSGMPLAAEQGEQRRNANGGMDLDVLVDRAVAKALQRPGSESGRTLGTLWGTKRQLTRRG